MLYEDSLLTIDARLLSSPPLPFSPTKLYLRPWLSDSTGVPSPLSPFSPFSDDTVVIKRNQQWPMLGCEPEPEQTDWGHFEGIWGYFSFQLQNWQNLHLLFGQKSVKVKSTNDVVCKVGVEYLGIIVFVQQLKISTNST